MMEGIHLLSEVSCRTRKWASILAGKKLKFEEAFQALKRICVLHEYLEVEAKDLREEVRSLSERNSRLVDDLCEILQYHEELKKLNHNLHIKVDDAICYCLGLNRELKAKTQQFESLKLQYTEAFLQLEITCSGKDGSIKLMQEEFSKLKNVISINDAQIASLGKLQTSVNHYVH